MKLTDWNNRPFINPLSAESLGKITGVYVTSAGVVKYLYADANAYRLSRLYANGDALLCAAPPETPERVALVHLGAKVYDTLGTYLGDVAEYDSDSLEHLTTLGHPLSRFVAGTPEYLIVNPANRVLNRKKRSPKPQKSTASAPETEAAETAVETPADRPTVAPDAAGVATGQPSEPTTAPRVTFTPLPFADHIRIEERETRASAPLHFEPPTPAREVDYGFLVGRRAERDVVDLTRTFLIPRGTLITAALVAQARRAGKIVDLASACSTR